ncbi:MAG: hypothetical protein ABJI22_15885 [Maribacter sp.]
MKVVKISGIRSCFYGRNGVLLLSSGFPFNPLSGGEDFIFGFEISGVLGD